MAALDVSGPVSVTTRKGFTMTSSDERTVAVTFSMSRADYEFLSALLRDAMTTHDRANHFRSVLDHAADFGKAFD